MLAVSRVGKFKSPFYPFKAHFDPVEPAGMPGVASCDLMWLQAAFEIAASTFLDRKIIQETRLRG
jgi:hypothetical protein